MSVNMVKANLMLKILAKALALPNMKVEAKYNGTTRYGNYIFNFPESLRGAQICTVSFSWDTTDCDTDVKVSELQDILHYVELAETDHYETQRKERVLKDTLASLTPEQVKLLEKHFKKT